MKNIDKETNRLSFGTLREHAASRREERLRVASRREGRKGKKEERDV
ncbi:MULTISPECIES: hypothetical protein [unclassified Nostoc]|nr:MULTISPECIES: hypothetical protein [unclassified Nostoc]MDZ8126261.1 hypothetical protein [Nostoc sp. CmiVER01]MDZ8227301.1 hypothetical protein [Nostoc sp. ChiVER01]